MSGGKYRCPECGEELVDVMMVDPTTDKSHNSMKCPNGCNFGSYFN